MTDYNRTNATGPLTKRRMYWHAFASFCITPRMQSAVLSFFETPENALLAGEREWEVFFRAAEQLKMTPGEKANIQEVRKRNHGKEYETLQARGISFVTYEDAAYPEALASLFEAPRFLYYKGTLPEKMPLVAIVGARKCTPYGRETAYRIARELAERGVGVISGLAYGVDVAAHEGALAGGGRTYAVLGCGVDVCYPGSHRNTYEKILSTGGGILSEYPPGTSPLSWFFPQRNRIIAGLSDGVLVTEARKKSGSLITVSLGLEYGKNIYAIPGRITDVLSEGCNYLLKEGAKPVCSADDIIEDLQGNFTVGKGKKREENCKNYEFLKNTLATNEKMVYAILRLEPKHIEEIQEETKLAPELLPEVLHTLCSYGCVKRYGQAYYALSVEGKGFLSER